MRAPVPARGPQAEKEREGKEGNGDARSNRAREPEAAEPETQREEAQGSATPVMDTRHLKGELGMRFQTYAESCQMTRRAPRGRAFLFMLSQHVRLDLNRGN